MITHNGFTFKCDAYHPDEPSGRATLVLADVRTERTAIEHARENGWSVVRVRAISGVPKDRRADTVRRVFCPGCAWLIGVFFK